MKKKTKKSKIKENQKDLEKLGIILVVVISVITILVLGIKANKDGSTLSIKDRVDKVNKLVIAGVSKEELNKVIKSDKLDSNYLLTGEDCYFRLKPSDEIIKNNNLANYSKIQNTLANKVEKLVSEELEIQMNDDKYIRKENNAKVYSGTLKAFYLTQYLVDLKNLEEKIYAEYSIEDNNEILRYKSKVMAMRILDEHLGEYKNLDQYSGFNIYVYEDDSKTADSIANYLNMLQGVNYSNETVTNLEKTREERLTSYLEDAHENDLFKDIEL